MNVCVCVSWMCVCVNVCPHCLTSCTEERQSPACTVVQAACLIIQLWPPHLFSSSSLQSFLSGSHSFISVSLPPSLCSLLSLTLLVPPRHLSLPFHLLTPSYHSMYSPDIYRSDLFFFFSSTIFFNFSRWRPQHFSPLRPPRPHHHRGHAGQQRHRPLTEHVPGALPVTAAG